MLFVSGVSASPSLSDRGRILAQTVKTLNESIHEYTKTVFAAPIVATAVRSVFLLQTSVFALSLVSIAVSQQGSVCAYGRVVMRGFTGVHVQLCMCPSVSVEGGLVRD